MNEIYLSMVWTDFRNGKFMFVSQSVIGLLYESYIFYFLFMVFLKKCETMVFCICSFGFVVFCSDGSPSFNRLIVTRCLFVSLLLFRNGAC